MKSIEFTAWLSGYFDLYDTDGVSEEQLEIIQEKLTTIIGRAPTPLRQQKKETKTETECYLQEDGIIYERARFAPDYSPPWEDWEEYDFRRTAIYASGLDIPAGSKIELVNKTTSWYDYVRDVYCISRKAMGR